MITLLDVRDVRTDLLDDARRFVPQHHRQRVRIEPLNEMQVRVAKAGIGRAQQDLARAGLADAHLFNDERLIHFIENGGFHGALLAFLLGETTSAPASRKPTCLKSPDTGRMDKAPQSPDRARRKRRTWPAFASASRCCRRPSAEMMVTSASASVPPPACDLPVTSRASRRCTRSRCASLSCAVLLGGAEPACVDGACASRTTNVTEASGASRRTNGSRRPLPATAPTRPRSPGSAMASIWPPSNCPNRSASRCGEGELVDTVCPCAGPRVPVGSVGNGGALSSNWGA